MKISISSMRGSIKNYQDLLSKKLDFDKHYKVLRDEMIQYEYMSKPFHNFADCLEDVEVNSIEELFDLFSEFDGGMGPDYGHVTVDVKENWVQILDSWIE
jgi:hypothetical protein